MAFFLILSKIIKLAAIYFGQGNSIPNNQSKNYISILMNQLIYVLPTLLKPTYLFFQKNCLSLGLPDPVAMNEINGKKLLVTFFSMKVAVSLNQKQ